MIRSITTFDQAVAFVLSNESAACLNDPSTGEYSRYGVTLASAAAFGLCASGDRSFIDRMTAAQAKSIYFDRFWTPLKLDAVRAAAVAAKLLDMAVNMGPFQAVKLAQQACNALGATLTPDGIVGWQTLTALNKLDDSHLVLELRAESVAFYKQLVDKDPAKYAKYWDGWKDRAEK